MIRACFSRAARGPQYGGPILDQLLTLERPEHATVGVTVRPSESPDRNQHGAEYCAASQT